MLKKNIINSALLIGYLVSATSVFAQDYKANYNNYNNGSSSWFKDDIKNESINMNLNTNKNVSINDDSNHSNNEDLLPVDQAFKTSVNLNINDNNLINVNFNLTNNYYLYKEKIFINNQNGTFENKNIIWPDNFKEIDDPNFGKIDVYKQSFSIEMPRQEAFSIYYQGCSSSGFCYIPVEEYYKINSDGLSYSKIDEEQWESISSNLKSNPHQETILEQIKISENNNMFDSLSNLSGIQKYLVFGVLIFFVGLGLSLTPCVLPMLPILISIILRDRENQSNKDKDGNNIIKNKFRAFSLCTSYVLGTSLTYVTLGLIASSFGLMFNNALQNIYVISIVSIIFIIFGLSLMDYLVIKTPQKLDNFIHNKISSFDTKRSNFVLFITGMLSALVLSPCMAAPMASIILFISTSQDMVFGAYILFCLSIGMGFILILAGTLSNKIIPKSGKWMEIVKFIFALFMIFIPFYFIAPFIKPIIYYILLTIVLLFVSYVINKKNIKFMYILLFFIGLIISLSHYQYIETRNNASSYYSSIITTNNQIDDAIKKGLNQNKSILINVSANWCTYCIDLENDIFNNDNNRNYVLNNFYLIKADVSDFKTGKHILKRLNVLAPPAFVLVDDKGTITNKKIVGYSGSNHMMNQLKTLKDNK